MDEEELRELIARLQEIGEEARDVFTDEGLTITECGPTVSLGHAVSFSSVWFGSAGQSSANAQSMASTRAFQHCLRRCSTLNCPSGKDCVFDTRRNEGFTGRCRYFTVYLGIHRKFFIRWHVSLAFAKCPCFCKCQ